MAIKRYFGTIVLSIWNAAQEIAAWHLVGLVIVGIIACFTSEEKFGLANMCVVQLVIAMLIWGIKLNLTDLMCPDSCTFHDPGELWWFRLSYQGSSIVFLLAAPLFEFLNNTSRLWLWIGSTIILLIVHLEMRVLHPRIARFADDWRVKVGLISERPIVLETSATRIE